MLDLTREQLAAVRAILAHRVPGREVRAFGSRVTGRAWRYSDLDLVVMGDAPLPALTLAHLRADFEDSDLPFRVDVLEARDLPADSPAAAGDETAVIQPATGVLDAELG
jgi:type I restriction enzyme S subunit